MTPKGSVGSQCIFGQPRVICPWPRTSTETAATRSRRIGRRSSGSTSSTSSTPTKATSAQPNTPSCSATPETNRSPATSIETASMSQPTSSASGLRKRSPSTPSLQRKPMTGTGGGRPILPATASSAGRMSWSTHTRSLRARWCVPGLVSTVLAPWGKESLLTLPIDHHPQTQFLAAPRPTMGGRKVVSTWTAPLNMTVPPPSQFARAVFRD